MQRSLQRVDRLGAAKSAKRFDRRQVELGKRAAIHVPDEIAVERRGALFAHLEYLAEQPLACRPFRGVQRVQEDDAGIFDAVHHQALHRFALDERLGIGEQRHELLEAFGAAELAQKEAAVRRTSQL